VSLGPENKHKLIYFEEEKNRSRTAKECMQELV